MKTVSLTISDVVSSASAPYTGTRTAEQLLAQLLGGGGTTTPPPVVTPPGPPLPIPFSHLGFALGDWDALEAATVPVEADDRADFDQMAPSRQPERWIEIVDKQIRRKGDD